MSPVIAIVGRPNVGKSTLFNRLTRSRGALVDDRPGITRDRLYAEAVLDGVTMTFVDTGGFDSIPEEPLLRQVVLQMDRAIQEAHGVIFVVDARQGLMPGDIDMAERLRGINKKVYLAVNKIDGPELEHLMGDFYSLGMDDVYPLSALHGYGISELIGRLSEELPDTSSLESSRESIAVAVLGKPNVGKSSLINRILDDDRLIVSEIPGTTRDSVDISFSMGGKDYVFIDTAGIRRKAKVKEKVEKFSVGKTLESLRRCDIAVIILDASEGATEQDARICNYAMEQGKGTVITVNKWDLVQGKRDLVKRLKESISLQLRFISFAPSLYLSAMTGKGVKRLFPVLDKLYGEISTRLPTSTVNSVIEAAFAENPPPRAGKRQLKISYATQAAIRPPTFVLFVNNAELMPDSYERYLVNRLRAELKLFHSPIKIVAREKGKKYTRSQGGQK